MYSFVKRVFDLAASGIAIVLLCPLWIIAAAGITVSDPGPVFYMAERVGKENRRFRMFKFRSMRVDHTADERSLRADSERIFPWGRIMRDTKLDELPQLLNVFIGDMSVIGPRPAAADQVQITRSGENAAVSSLKPGLSSPSALYDYIYGDRFENETEYMEKVLPTRLALDLYYLKRQGIVCDIRTIWYTVVCILSRIFHREPGRLLEKLNDAAKSTGAAV